MTSLQSNVAAAYLIIEQNRRWSDVYRLTLKGTTRLGRSSQNQIVVSDDRSSRFHAEIQFIEKRWMLQDLNSRNGTLVDGKPITGLHALQSGQTIQIGGCIYRFTNKLAVAAKSNSQGNLSSPAHTSQSDQSELQSQRFTGTNLNLEGLAAIQSQAAGKASVHPIGREQPRRWVTEMSVAMMEAPSFADAAAVALQIILQHCKVEAGAILSIEGNNIATILSTAQKPGRAYRRIADSLVTQCVQSNQALLARNFEAESSQIICAPINNGKTTIGLIHIYSEAGDTALDAKSLVEVTAAAEALSVTLPHLRQQGKLRRQLKRTKTQLEALSSQLDQDTAQGQMVGHSKVLENLKERLKRVARSDSTLLLRGESGVGKGLAARFTHWQSPRKSQPFLSVNCAALTASMLESELFGHEKGGVPGAMTRKIGKFELADGGTLMLDEVGAMSAELQTKFLSVLEGQPFERVGGSEPIATDVRIVAATNRDLEQAVQAGHFRDDLYFRLRVVELTVPPLRKRADDIVPAGPSVFG